MKDLLPYVAFSLVGLGLVLALLGVAIEAKRGAGATPPYDSRGRLLVSRKVILAGGAFLGSGSLLMVAPGCETFGLGDWWAGAFFGFLLCYLIHMVAKIRRGLAATRRQEPKT
jgi:hypothetical protein